MKFRFAFSVSIFCAYVFRRVRFRFAVMHCVACVRFFSADARSLLTPCEFVVDFPTVFVLLSLR